MSVSEVWILIAALARQSRLAFRKGRTGIPRRAGAKRGRGMSDIEALGGQALADIDAAASPDALEHLRVSLLGKQGSITAQL